jgi:putative ABC transport system substrate-binding protein
VGRAATEGVHGMITLSSPVINAERSQIASLALQNRIPTISLFTLFAESGGLMAYGPNLQEMYRRAATYVDKIPRGAAAGSLPIERPSRFEFVVNLKTAKALGLTIPPSLVLRAEKVIE